MPRKSRLALLTKGPFAFEVILGQPGIGLQIDFRLEHCLQSVRERGLHELEGQGGCLGVLQRELARARQSSTFSGQLIDEPDALGTLAVDGFRQRDELPGAGNTHSGSAA